MFRFAAAVLGLLLTVSAVNAELPAAPRDRSASLKWNKNVIPLAVSSSLTRPGSNIKLDSDVAGAVLRSIEAWESVANITIQQTSSDRQSASPSGAAGDGTSLLTIGQTPENVLMFGKGLDDAPARTRIFVDRKGQITEADIVLNPYQQFSTDGTFGTFDLQSVITHELGHLLGLQHSSIIGSTMHEQIGRNGLYGLQNVSVRTLSAADISAVRALYGLRGSDEACCGRISGKLSFAGQNLKGSHVWAENADNGDAAAETTVGADGTFRLSGLPAGGYRLYIQDENGAALKLAQDPGVTEVAKGAVTSWSGRVKTAGSRLQLSFLGVNGQLAEAVVPVNRDRTYSVYVGGTDLDPAKITIGSTSPLIEVDQASISRVDYRDDLSVVRFTLRVTSAAPAGNYSLFVQADDGVRSYLPGAVAVEEFDDPFNPSVYSGE